MAFFTPIDSYSRLSNTAPSESKVFLTSIFSYHPSSILFPSRLTLSFHLTACMCKLLCPVLRGVQLTQSQGRFSVLGLDPSGALYFVSPILSLLCVYLASTVLVSCRSFYSRSCKRAFSVWSLSFALFVFGSMSQF